MQANTTISKDNCHCIEPVIDDELTSTEEYKEALGLNNKELDYYDKNQIANTVWNLVMCIRYQAEIIEHRDGLLKTLAETLEGRWDEMDTDDDWLVKVAKMEGQYAFKPKDPSIG